MKVYIVKAGSIVAGQKVELISLNKAYRSLALARQAILDLEQDWASFMETETEITRYVYAKDPLKTITTTTTTRTTEYSFHFVRSNRFIEADSPVYTVQETEVSEEEPDE